MRRGRGRALDRREQAESRKACSTLRHPRTSCDRRPTRRGASQTVCRALPPTSLQARRTAPRTTASSASRCSVACWWAGRCRCPWWPFGGWAPGRCCARWASGQRWRRSRRTTYACCRPPSFPCRWWPTRRGARAQCQGWGAGTGGRAVPRTSCFGGNTQRGMETWAEAVVKPARIRVAQTPASHARQGGSKGAHTPECPWGVTQRRQGTVSALHEQCGLGLGLQCGRETAEGNVTGSRAAVKQGGKAPPDSPCPPHTCPSRAQVLLACLCAARHLIRPVAGLRPRRGVQPDANPTRTRSRLVCAGGWCRSAWCTLPRRRPWQARRFRPSTTGSSSTSECGRSFFSLAHLLMSPGWTCARRRAVGR